MINIAKSGLLLTSGTGNWWFFFVCVCMVFFVFFFLNSEISHISIIARKQ